MGCSERESKNKLKICLTPKSGICISNTLERLIIKTHISNGISAYDHIYLYPLLKMSLKSWHFKILIWLEGSEFRFDKFRYIYLVEVSFSVYMLIAATNSNYHHMKLKVADRLYASIVYPSEIQIVLNIREIF